MLKPGGRFVIYDITLPKPSEVDDPLPWAERAADSFLCSSEDDLHTLQAAGFVRCAAEDLTDLAIDFFAAVGAGRQEGPSPLGLHLLLGDTAPQKLAHVGRQVHARRLAPTLLTGHRA